MIEKVDQQSRIIFGRWEYVFVITLTWAASKAHFQVEKAWLVVIITSVMALAFQRYPGRVKETVTDYVVRTILVAAYALFAIMVAPAILKIFLPVPLAYGAPVFLFCLSKYKLSRPEYFADSFLKWSVFSFLVSIICAVLAYFVVR
jgi:hypothetical protein